MTYSTAAVKRTPSMAAKETINCSVAPMMTCCMADQVTIGWTVATALMRSTVATVQTRYEVARERIRSTADGEGTTPMGAPMMM